MSFYRQSPVIFVENSVNYTHIYVLRICSTHAPRRRTSDKGGKKKKNLNYSLPIGYSSHNSDVRFGSCKIFHSENACTLYSATNVADKGKYRKGKQL